MWNSIFCTISVNWSLHFGEANETAVTRDQQAQTRAPTRASTTRMSTSFAANERKSASKRGTILAVAKQINSSSSTVYECCLVWFNCWFWFCSACCCSDCRYSWCDWERGTFATLSVSVWHNFRTITQCWRSPVVISSTQRLRSRACAKTFYNLAINSDRLIFGCSEL